MPLFYKETTPGNNSTGMLSVTTANISFVKFKKVDPKANIYDTNLVAKIKIAPKVKTFKNQLNSNIFGGTNSGR